MNCATAARRLFPGRAGFQPAVVGVPADNILRCNASAFYFSSGLFGKMPKTAGWKSALPGNPVPSIMKSLLTLALPLYMLDQITKYLARTNIEYGDSREIIPGFFNLSHVTNTGAAFGSFSGSNVFFIILASVVGLGLLVAYLRGAFVDRWSRLAVVLLLSGIVGNLTDRILLGHVIDFLDFYVGRHHWPSFNVADSCICVAAGLFFFTAVQDARRKASK